MLFKQDIYLFHIFRPTIRDYYPQRLQSTGVPDGKTVFV